MSNTPPPQFYFDGIEPYAGAQTSETITLSSGTIIQRFHAYPLKQGSTQSINIILPGITVGDYTYEAKFRRSHTDATIQATASITVSGAEQITLTLSAVQMDQATFENASGVWDLEATKTSTGTIDRWIEGTYQVMPEVTY